jgi:hypothetical protein
VSSTLLAFLNALHGRSYEIGEAQVVNTWLKTPAKRAYTLYAVISWALGLENAVETCCHSAQFVIMLYACLRHLEGWENCPGTRILRIEAFVRTEWKT